MERVRNQLAAPQLQSQHVSGLLDALQSSWVYISTVDPSDQQVKTLASVCWDLDSFGDDPNSPIDPIDWILTIYFGDLTASLPMSWDRRLELLLIPKQFDLDISLARMMCEISGAMFRFLLPLALDLEGLRLGTLHKLSCFS